MKSTQKKVLILGSAALKIGEAGEFDYSGSQAIKALKEEGVFTVLVNPNIATIQTSEHLADRVYFLPVTVDFVEQIIDKEKPDAILLSFGGQTALNTGLALYEKGVLDKYKVAVLGTPVQTIIDTEDRQRFIQRLDEIGVKTARSDTATTVKEAAAIAADIGYPVMVRVAYALGGLGSGICRNEDELKERAGKALSHAPQILIEEYLTGWKEIEYEVVRDRADNCITVCNMENFDPMGIHTGESIVVAPSQTLSNSEYHKLRSIAIKVIRHLGIVGECNIQYALDPHSEDYRVIEVNARLSRSSALASKATGYPLAFVAAKLALGYTLPELKNSITKETSAFFEPALDYVVVKIPRWDLKKFRLVSRKIGSGMKSVGEIMAIGRHFEEALQKGLRMLETGAYGLVANDNFTFENITEELRSPTEERIFAIVQAFQQGFTIDEIHELSHIDKWFLNKLQKVVDISHRLGHFKHQIPEEGLLKEAKQAGFSDKQIARLCALDEKQVRKQRHHSGLLPVIRQIDTLAAEYPAQTNYLYLTYNGQEDDVTAPDGEAILVLGSGAYRIGSSVEFDWCCVSAARSLQGLGYRTIMLNYNPETVSTDYDQSDMLIFDEISLESVCDIFKKLNPRGVIISMGGQIPNNLAVGLDEAGIPILGTSAEHIDSAENRHKFSTLLDKIGVDQPVWKELSSTGEALAFAQKVGYPVLVRPSYVLSGAAMAVASNDEELLKYLQKAVTLSPEQPTVISKFLQNAKEIELDAVAREGEIVAYAISEHVENAGVHSGDATLVFPPQRLYLETIRRIRDIAARIARALKIHGPFNIQFIARQNEVKVIECNLRASRSFPFVSKILKINFIDIATQVMMGRDIQPPQRSAFEINYVGVKAPQFSFTRLIGADPVLGVEMTSTGEVACLGDDFDEAYLKALMAVGYRFPFKNVLLSTGPIESKAELLESIRLLSQNGMTFYATAGTARFLKQNGLSVKTLHWPLDEKKPNVIDYIRNGKIDLVINIPKNFQKDELTNGYLIRRAAVDYNVMLITNRQIAMRLVEALTRLKTKDLKIKSWEEYE
ncbi:MAG TPA: carbamoyl-phosphate synthase (glutamine-hydrolyzing) large subunit [Caldithrix abyssi]|uniref:Carbamoyl-phosphate synthase (Glutamine-hydrolyzing) large subunit n=1 Tax=Caldithrix abyssi TaxID=187145 RepID=A0A7V4TYZ5_CALAY|nr:carbamoyl-phosphate synthase (glutamine-hydrolyzing) large subunit [Caldithrix abyssi]